MALNVVCCETALRLELRAKRKCGACARNDADEPKRRFDTINYRIAKGLFDDRV
jgi:hypothetical protein